MDSLSLLIEGLSTLKLFTSLNFDQEAELFRELKAKCLKLSYFVLVEFD